MMKQLLLLGLVLSLAASATASVPLSIQEGDSSVTLPVPSPNNVKPSYPGDARKAGDEGTVVLKIVVLESGLVGRIEIQRGHEPFTSSATTAVRTWRYSPATRGGRPISVYQIVQIPFHLVPTPTLGTPGMWTLFVTGAAADSKRLTFASEQDCVGAALMSDGLVIGCFGQFDADHPMKPGPPPPNLPGSWFSLLMAPASASWHARLDAPMSEWNRIGAVPTEEQCKHVLVTMKEILFNMIRGPVAQSRTALDEAIRCVQGGND